MDIRSLSAITAAEARWLGLLAEFDRRGGWRDTGCLSCATWLAWQTSLDLRTAHEKVRVAHALEAFPELAAQMATGALSYAKVRALTRIVTVVNVSDLIAFGLAATSNQVERFVTAFGGTSPTAGRLSSARMPGVGCGCGMRGRCARSEPPTPSADARRRLVNQR